MAPLDPIDTAIDGASTSDGRPESGAHRVWAWAATLYAFPDPLSRIGVRRSPFSRDSYVDGEMEDGKISIPRRTNTLPLGPGNLILVALALAWEIVAMRIIYLICGDNWPRFLLQHNGLSLLKGTRAGYFDRNNTKLTEAVVDTRGK